MNYQELIQEAIKNCNIINIECDDNTSNEIFASLKNNNDIGIVEKNSVFYERLSVKDNLKMFAQLFNQEQLFDSVIQAMELQDFINLKCSKLSDSQMKRVAIARELLKKPKVIFIQEPILNLDEASIAIIMNFFDNYKEEMSMITTSTSLRCVLLLPGESYSCTQDQFIRINEKEQDESDTHNPFKIEKISVKLDDKVYLFDPNDIDYVESVNSKSMICVHGSTFIGTYTMDELERRLKRYGFYRSHRSYLVNMQKVNEVVKWTKNSYSLKLRNLDDTPIPLSKGRVEQLREYFHF